MLTLYHQYNEPILLAGKENRDSSQAIICEDWWGWESSFRETLKRSIVFPPMWRQIDLVTQSQEIHWKKHLVSQEQKKNIYFCFIDYAKAFNCVDHNKLWKILEEIRKPDHLTCFLRNLYAGQQATVRTGHGTTDWFQIGTGVRQGCILSPCLFNLYAEYIMQNARLDEAQAAIKIAERNINILRYADDTTLSAESKELKSLFMKEKEEWKSWLKTQHSKN